MKFESKDKLEKFRLTGSMQKRLAAEKKRSGLTKGEIIRRAIELYFEAREEK
jgi:predicted DNA-binding protein